MPQLSELLDHIEIITSLIPYTSIEEIENALVKAIQINKYNMVKFLLSLPVIDINSSKMRLLHEAVYEDDLDMVQLLLEHNANSNISDIEGITPVMLASQNGQIEILKLLLEHNANINTTCFTEKYFPLYYAVSENHLDVVNFLLDNNVNIDQTVHDGTTVLSLACYRGQIKITNLLISRNANVNHRRLSGDTVLQLALQQMRHDIVKILLESQADPFSSEGLSYLSIPILKNDTRSLMLLLRVGLNVNYLNPRNETPLYQALTDHHSEIVVLLLEEKADINLGKSITAIYINNKMVYDLEFKQPGYHHSQKLKRLFEFYNRILRVLPSDLSSLVVEYLEFTTSKEIMLSREKIIVTREDSVVKRSLWSRLFS